MLDLVHTDADARRWYVPIDGPGGLRPWFVDTGYAATTCDDDLVADLGLRPTGVVYVRGEAGGLWARTVRLPAFQLGDHEVRGLWCVVRDLGATSSIDDPVAVRVAGVLGSDVLRRFDVVFDPSTPAMTLSAPGTAPRPTDAPGRLVRRDPAGGRRPALGVHVKSRAGDERDLPVLFDTGASQSFLDAERFGWDPSFVARDVRVRGTGAKGGKTRDLAWYDAAIAAPGVPPVWVRVGQRHRRAGTAGLLGLDVIAQHRVTLVFSERAIWFEPVTATPTPEWTAWAAARSPLP